METEPEGSPRRIHPDVVFDVGLMGLFAGIVGARFLFVVLDWKDFAQRPLDALKVWSGGLSLHGGLLFGILFLIAFCRKKKINVLAMADLGAPAFALAYAFGRVGCFLNGCCYGGACSLPWGVRFHDERFPYDPNALTEPSHPIQLYGTLINLVFFFLLTRWERFPRRDGEMFYAYLAMYGSYRYFVETFRAGVTSTYLIPSLHLTDTHLVSIAMILIGVVGVAWLRRHRPAVRNAATA